MTSASRRRAPDVVPDRVAPGLRPELNPEDQCNGAVKREMLNALPDSPEAMRALARRHFARLDHRPDLLRACFVHAGLNLN